MRKKLILLLVCLLAVSCLVGCGEMSESTSSKLATNISSSTNSASKIIENQPAPTDLDYSLERYNLIKRAYWVNGQRERANSLICEVEKPLGYIVLLSNSGAIVGNFVVDGKVSSLGSYLFPAYIDQDYTGDTVGQSPSYEGSIYSVEIPGIDGAYGSNITGVFFFTPDGKYIEWTGDFLYSDIPFEVDAPILKVDNR